VPGDDIAKTGGERRIRKNTGNPRGRGQKVGSALDRGLSLAYDMEIKRAKK